MQRGGPGAEFATSVLAKIINRDVAEINLRKTHRRAVARGLGAVIDGIHKHRHPLLASCVRINCATGLSRGLDLHAFGSRLGSVIRIHAFHEQIEMPVEMTVLREHARVLRQTLREHSRREGVT